MAVDAVKQVHQTVAYRRDGWPLCPRCGQDALRSLVPLVVKKRPREPRATDEMRCGSCRWNGCLPARAEAEATVKVEVPQLTPAEVGLGEEP